MNTAAPKARPSELMPVKSALSATFSQLQRCERFVESIHAHIHGEQVTEIAPGKEYEPSPVHEMSNTLSRRLDLLADQLETINNSF